MKRYTCCDEHRRDAVRAQHTIKGVDFNGIDYLEVVDDTDTPPCTLQLHFIHALKPGTLGKENVRITGGARIHDVLVLSADSNLEETIKESGSGATDVAIVGKEREATRTKTSDVDVSQYRSNILKVKVNKPGDYSTYTLTVFADPKKLQLDPLLSSIDFTFQPSSNIIDCQTGETCQPDVMPPTPEIDYLARDFTSFRQLMLDRLSVLLPQWSERSAADLGVMLVELLAYVADHLSYQQDVIATEAYLSTARRRTSARRHVRLLDYLINEGCNARVWVQVQVKQDIVATTADTSVLQNTMLLTQAPGQNAIVLAPDSQAYIQAINTQPTVFEPLESIHGLYADHNEILFYTWNERECCLPKGSTQATLRGTLPYLQPGDVLIFKELVDPHTGTEEDAEPTHRHAVRLTKVLPGSDPLGTWPNDQSDPQNEPSSQDRVIAELRIVEEDRLLIEEADMTTSKAGHSIREVDKQFEEETRTVIRRFLIEKPDHSTVTVEVHMREDDHDVQVRVLDEGHIVKKHTREEPYTREVDTRAETHTQEASAALLQDDQTANTDTPVEWEENTEDEAKRPTVKLPKLPTTPRTRFDDIADIDTVPMFMLQSKEETKDTEVQKEQSTKEEHGKEGDTTIEKEGEHIRVVHTYSIVREPNYAVDITEITWSDEDALPFPLCISATTDYESGHRYIENVSVALGNIVLADHGMTWDDEKQKDHSLIPYLVPDSTMSWATNTHSQPCEQQQSVQVPPRFYPQLKYTPVTFAAPYDEHDTTLSATAAMQFDQQNALPKITLNSSIRTENTNIIDPTPMLWNPQQDLLGSNATDAHFVVESEADGATSLRFGDGQHGLRPDPRTSFLATYRVGNGAAGNIGRDSLYHLVSSDPRLPEAVSAISNPLPAQGGTDPESIEDIRKNAAGTFNLAERGITPQDYIDIATRDPQVHRANAILRWTGSWYTLFLVVERVKGLPVDDTFKSKIRQSLEQYRMAGTDLVIVSPVYVPLQIALDVTVQPGYLPVNVKTALQKVFSNRQWPDGERGVFYTDNYTFGEPVYLNPLYVAASSVPGVATATVTTFQREGIAGTGLADGVLPLDWLELPILENNPLYPERGIFSLTVEATNVEVQYVRG